MASSFSEYAQKKIKSLLDLLLRPLLELAIKEIQSFRLSNKTGWNQQSASSLINVLKMSRLPCDWHDKPSVRRVSGLFDV